MQAKNGEKMGQNRQLKKSFMVQSIENIKQSMKTPLSMKKRHEKVLTYPAAMVFTQI